jgi:UDP-2,4-diacetamido-2,4,6-trideoxy-beta-L-altropyranose hydrolase
MTGQQRVVFRADGNSEMGLGHMIRSSALADAIGKNYHCILTTRCTVDSVLAEMKTVFKEIIQLPVNDFKKEAESLSTTFRKNDLFVLDGYSFDTTYQNILKENGFDFFCIDDIHAYKFFSTVIINHGGGLTPFDYAAEPGTQYYLGPRYALLRSSFLAAASEAKRNSLNKNCFVCFGGADPNNKTLEIISNKNILDSPRFNHFHVVVGGAYMHYNSLEAFVKNRSNISLHRSLSLEGMVSTMKKCSYAICSPSTIVYEYMSVGGVVFLEQIADNQKDIIKYLTEEGYAFKLDQLDGITDTDIRDSLIKQANVFDGKSGERLNKIFDQYYLARHLSIRNVCTEDLQICFDWANDTDVRAQSYNKNQISLDEHSSWFQNKLNDQNSFFYILELNEKPVAQIRFQVNNGEAVLGYLADKSIRSKGLGTAILAAGIEKFIKDYKKAVTITGFVKNSNIASKNSFERLAFKKAVSSEYPDSLKYQMHHGN